MAARDDWAKRRWRQLRALESRLFEVPPAHRIGSYRIEDVLGAGALGVVFRAHDEQRERTVAIKLLHGDSGLPTRTLHRTLRREAKSLALLNHPNIVGSLGIESLDTSALPIDVDGELGLVMEYVDGTTVRRWMDEEPRSPRDILGVFLQSAAGLHAAHQAGVVHRDFKPGNVMLDAAGCARVVDFGLGRILEGDSPATTTLRELVSGQGPTAVGTPLYMAPEVHAGAAGSPASDQYSFCVALFEALVGRLPFTGSTLLELESAKQTQTPAFDDAPHRLSGRLKKAIRRGLAVYPEERHDAVSELAADLERTSEARGGAWASLRNLLG